MSFDGDTLLSWAIGRGANLAKAHNKKGSWKQLKAMLRKVQRTGENYKTYMKLPKDDQLPLKSVNGWISGAQCEGDWRNLRNVKPRDLMTLDSDYPWSETWDLLETGVHWLCQYEFAALTTRSHSPEEPRYRMVLPMSRMVSPDEYGPLVRIVAFLFDGGQQPMEQIDVVSSRKAQMMFLPTASKDGEFKFLENAGDALDPDALFAYWRENHGDPFDLANQPLFKGEDKLRKRADKAEDPWLKPGMIGNWCRAYTIQEVIAEFLSDVYTPGDQASGKPRYTFTGGSASNGAVVEDDGRFLYSHHGTDPVGETLVNAWDLVRVHLFGQLDEAKDQDKPVGERPSSKGMREFIADKKPYLEEVLKSRYDQSAMFEDIDLADEDFPEYTAGESDPQDDIDDLVGDGPEPAQPEGAADAADRQPKKPRGKKPSNPRSKTWFGEELDIDQNGNIKSNVYNVSVIVYNDPRFYDAIRWDEFAHMARLFWDIRSKSANIPDLIVSDPRFGDRWDQRMHITVRAILATPNGPGKVGYGLGNTAERDIDDGVRMAAHRNGYHPIKDDLSSVEWDGVERLDTLFIDFLGVPDTPYARETARMTLVASVARIFEPGHKFDFAPVLQGATGIRKSSFIQTLYQREYFGEIDCKLDDTQKVAETITGKWGVELPELTSLSKSDHNDAKQFMSRQVDTVRLAYARHVSVLPRQIVVWGTTNDSTYLKDPTGNRRYWPQLVLASYIDTDRLVAERAQIWAEALVAYRAMRAEQPTGDLPLFLTSREARTEAVRLQEGAREHGMIEEYAEAIESWLDTPIPLARFAIQVGRDPHSLPGVPEGTNPETTWVKRVAFNTAAAAVYAMGMDNWPGHNANLVLAAKKAVTQFCARRGWVAEQGGMKKRRYGGNPVVWHLKPGASDLETAMGFVFVPKPEDVEPGFAEQWFADEDIDVSGSDYNAEIDDLV